MTKVKHKSKNMRYILLFLIILGAIAMDMRMKVVVYTLDAEQISTPIRVALITDLESCYYGKNQETIVKAMEKNEPDLVLYGGDIFDDQLDFENAIILVQRLAKSYPCYYVTGNHDLWSGEIQTVFEILTDNGVTILDGTQEIIEINGEKIQLCGVSDSDAVRYIPNHEGVQAQLDKLELDPELYTILLAHRPEEITRYEQYPFDLVLAGHAHGGQWRIPGILNGLYSPNQGIFPPYAGGYYQLEGLDFIVSRGLARESVLAPRIFNRPELVFVDIV